MSDGDSDSIPDTDGVASIPPPGPTYLIHAPGSNSDPLSDPSSDIISDASSSDIHELVVLGGTSTHAVLTGLGIVDIEGHNGLNHIAKFRGDRIEGPGKPDSYYDDLFMARFQSISHIWGGGQKRKMTFNFSDSTSDTDHVEKATREPSHLSDPVPSSRK